MELLRVVACPVMRAIIPPNTSGRMLRPIPGSENTCEAEFDLEEKTTSGGTRKITVTATVSVEQRHPRVFT